MSCYTLAYIVLIENIPSFIMKHNVKVFNILPKFYFSYFFFPVDFFLLKFLLSAFLFLSFPCFCMYFHGQSVYIRLDQYSRI